VAKAYTFTALRFMTTAVVQKLHVLVLLHQLTFLSEKKHLVTVLSSQDGSVTWVSESKRGSSHGKRNMINGVTYQNTNICRNL
jgi:hypothetical protein